MIAKLLEDLAPELLRVAKEQAGSLRHGNSSSDELLAAMLTALTASLRKQKLDISTLQDGLLLGANLESFRTAARLVEDAVYKAIEERQLAIPPQEARIIGAWAAALSERALRVENRRFRAMLDAIPDHLFLQDAAGRFVYLNRAMAEALVAMSGSSGRALIGQSVHDLDFADEFHRYLRHVHERVSRGELVTEEFQLPLPGMAGSTWREHHVAPLLDDQGHVEAIAIASRDIQARKVAEGEAQRAQAELAQAVIFREQLMAKLSHDLRNPLSSVLSLAALLLGKDVPDRVREGLVQIERSAERMNEMIRTILDATQLRFVGAPRLHRSESQLDTIAGAVIEELRAVHPGCRIELATSGDLGGWWDAGRIAQVASNLIGNAVKHGAVGAPVLVRLAREEREVVMAVSNSGTTIPAADIDHLFDAFWQAPGEGLAPRGGLGLGLFIVREIVRAHDGTVAVSSAEGSTTFTVRLPWGR